VGNVAVFEAAHYVGNGIAFADVGKELVAQALALGGARYQACDVGKFHRGRYGLLRIHDRRKLVQARVGNGDDAGVGLDSAERKILCGYTGLG